MLRTLKHYPIPRLTGPQQKGLFLFSLLILAFLGFHYWGWGPKPGAMNKSYPPEQRITIDLDGKVKRPGLLSYSQPPTVQQVIRDAGGLGMDQRLSSTEGAMLLENDCSLTVLEKNHGEILLRQGPLSGKALWILGRPIPLNQATAEDLGRLPGVGPTLALRIVEYREAHGEFLSLEELKEVQGIKEKTFDKIKKYFTL